MPNHAYGIPRVADGYLGEAICVKRGGRDKCKVFRNPLLERLLAIFTKTARDERDLETLILALPPPWHAQSASWRSTLVTQPPTSQAFLIVDHGCTLGSFKALELSPDKLRMGDIVEKLIENDCRAAKLGFEKYVDADSLDCALTMKSNEQLAEVTA